MTKRSAHYEEALPSLCPPFEREDISDLALRLDDIVDGMNSVANTLVSLTR